MKIAYLGIDLLQSVLHAALSQGCEVLKIYSCETDNVTEFNTGVCAEAARRGIPVSMAPFSLADIAWLEAQGCELLLCAGYYHRIPTGASFPMINVHPAPLPQCRGPWPMPLILLGAYPCGGVAFHKMEAAFDTGDLLLTDTFALAPQDTLADYMDKLNARIPGMVRALLSDLPGLARRAKPQGAGRYLQNPTPDCWTVCESMTASQADRVLRAFYGYECIYCRGRARYELIGARAFAGEEREPFPLADGCIRADHVKRLNDA